MIDMFETNISKGEELQVYHFGMQKCDKGHSYGPAVREHFLIHFIMSGKGIFKVGDMTYQLQKNQAFLIMPYTVTYYQADFENPWTYCWIGFNGFKAYTVLKEANFTLKSPIFNYNDSCLIDEYMEKMLNMDIDIPGSDLRRKGCLYIILSEIQRINSSSLSKNYHRDQKEVYIEKAIDFIGMNYSMNINIRDIAKYIGLDRSYFSTLFKRSLNVSPQDYLINFRIKKGAGLLENTSLSVGDIARSVGYVDPLCFSKVFKKVMGISPQYYRNLPK